MHVGEAVAAGGVFAGEEEGVGVADEADVREVAGGVGAGGGEGALGVVGGVGPMEVSAKGYFQKLSHPSFSRLCGCCRGGQAVAADCGRGIGRDSSQGLSVCVRDRGRHPSGILRGCL